MNPCKDCEIPLRKVAVTDLLNPPTHMADIPLVPWIQNDYLCDWTSHKDKSLHAILDVEDPPLPRACSMCVGDGTYRCNDCFAWPLFCAQCCRKQHVCIPFHRIEKWTGQFFDDSLLHLVSALQSTLLSNH